MALDISGLSFIDQVEKPQQAKALDISGLSFLNGEQDQQQKGIDISGLSFLNGEQDQQQKGIDISGLSFLKDEEQKPKVDKEEQKEQNKLFWVLDQINRFQYAAANVIYDAVNKGDFKGVESLVDGFTLKEKRSISDSISALGWNPKTKTGKLAKIILGLVGDIATDPLTYTGIGLIGKGGNLIKASSKSAKLIKAGRAVGKAKDTTATLTVFGKAVKVSGKIVDPISRSLSRIGFKARESKGLGDVLNVFTSISTKMRPKGVNPTKWVKFLETRADALNLKKAILTGTREKAIDIYNKIKKSKVGDETVESLIQAIESGQDITAKLFGDLSGEAAGLITAAGKETVKFGEKIKSKLIEVRHPVVEEGMRHLPHVLIDKAAKKLGFASKQFNTKTVSSKSALIAKMTGILPDEFKKVKKLDSELKSLAIKADKVNSKMEVATSKLVDVVTSGKKDKFVNTQMKKIEIPIGRLKQLNSRLSNDINKAVALGLAAKNGLLDTAGHISRTKLVKRIDKLKGKIYKEYDDVVSKLKIEKTKLGKAYDEKKFAPLENTVKKLTEYKTQLNKQITDLQEEAYGIIFNNQEYIVNLKSGSIYLGGKKMDSKLSGNMIKKAKNNLLEFGTMKRSTIMEVKKAIGAKVFSTNLPELVVTQGSNFAQTYSSAKFFNEVGKLGRNINLKNMTDSTMDFIAKNKLKQTNVPELKGKFFDEEIADNISQVWTKMNDPKVIKQWKEVYDKIYNINKATLTYVNPAFHVRNMIGNVANVFLAVDTWNPLKITEAFIEAGKIQAAKTWKYLDKGQAKDLKDMINNGIVGGGFFGSDMAKNIREEAMGMFELLKKGKVFGLGRRVGEAVENNARMAAYLLKRKEGYGVKDAASIAKDFLFDYSDLTDVERKIKKVIPFYSWTRKNIPRQFKSLVEKPAKQTLVLKVKNNIETIQGDDKTRALLPKWFQDAAPIFVGRKKNIVRYIKLEGLLPISDLAKIPLPRKREEILDEFLSNPVKEMISMVSPILKLLPEQGLNYNFFFGKEIDNYPKKDFFGWQIPARLEYLARMFRPISEIEKITVGSWQRKYKSMTYPERLINFAMGGKIYDYNVKDLLRQFDWMTEKEAMGLKRQISNLKRQIKKEPKLREQNQKDIKMLWQLLKKAKIKANREKRRAREALQ